MSKKIEISSYKELIAVILIEDITLAEAEQITNKYLNVWCGDNKSKNELTIKIKEFVETYGNTRQKPLFLQRFKGIAKIAIN